MDTKTSSSTLTNPRRDRRVRRPNLNKGRTDREYVTKAEVKGGKISVPTNPPEITYQPWMPVICMIRHNGGELKATISTIADALIDQIDPLRHALREKTDKSVNKNGGPLFQFRLRNVRAWNLTGHMIALSVNDLTDNSKTNTDCLCGLMDTGSSLHIPAVGFEMPLSHKDLVLRNGLEDKDDPLFHVIVPPNDSCIVYVGIFWRCDGPSKFSSFTESMLSVMRQVRDSTDRTKSEVIKVRATVRDIAKSAESSDKHLGVLEEHTRGSIGSQVINGILREAPYVLAAAAAEDSAKMDELIREVRCLNDGGFERLN